MDYVNPGGHTVILTPGRYNAAYFEHSYLAEKTGAHLANGSELVVEDDKLYYRAMDGKLERVGAVYRRISDEYLDPMNFNPESLIGIPHIYDVFKKGNVALLKNEPRRFIAQEVIDFQDLDILEADRLFWLGRYTERVYTTRRMYPEFPEASGYCGLSRT